MFQGPSGGLFSIFVRVLHKFGVIAVVFLLHPAALFAAGVVVVAAAAANPGCDYST